MPGFGSADAVPVPMNADDVIFHNIQLLHGSPEGDGNFAAEASIRCQDMMVDPLSGVGII
ncbi:phytanoyl-CoA dioxygenase family protein [Paenibacillus sp. 32352]|uniref:phytanoyl-CoA dioxygenase family protein n=1 Tax=Paenibacillus sp. 32352 TaxID=1969111 RepID=UPI002118C8F8|nr:phytanoyl-CoA dioxygenase family protein [Paenibacillus sp. 32352]